MMLHSTATKTWNQPVHTEKMTYHTSVPKVLTIIPARGGSKGVSRKNIRDLAGKPLIYWTIKAAQDSGVVDRLVVSTEDEEIAEVARSFGAEIIDRPKELAEDATKTEPVMLHALDVLEKQGYQPDYVSLIQCTSPFLKSEVVRTVATKLIEHPDRYDSCGTYYEPHYSFRWKKTEDDRFESEFPVMDRPRRQDLILEYPYCGAGACYIISTELFRKTGNRYGGNDARIGGVLISEQDALQIDTEYDLLIANELMKRKLLQS
jgi:CMP-N,N'-diacetyllegionaminic acid synthase